MNRSIRIPVPLVALVVIAGIVAAVMAQLPEIRRYLKVKSM
ncbi:MAG: hypothetical protein ABSG43_02800 [Solirubrobacteraceae bacterium]|jgi:hypothetical protein